MNRNFFLSKTFVVGEHLHDHHPVFSRPVLLPLFLVSCFLGHEWTHRTMFKYKDPEGGLYDLVLSTSVGSLIIKICRTTH